MTQTSQKTSQQTTKQIQVNNLRLDAEGLNLIKRWEGLRLEAYLCSANVWTIGYGHTKTAKPGMKITEEKANELLREDVRKFENLINRIVTVPLTQNQFNALVSWAFNVGENAVKNSTLIRKLNSGDYDAVPFELMRWNKINGQVNRGLTNRRAAEVGLWARGSFVASNFVEPENPVVSENKEITSKTIEIGTVAATAGALSPLLSSLSNVPVVVSIVLITAVFMAIFFFWYHKNKK